VNGICVQAVRPTAEQWCYAFGAGEPLASLKPGQLLRVWTPDCFGGAVSTTDDLAYLNLDRVNPVAGPFCVEGAKRGDTLAIHFVSITPATPRAVSAVFPHFGVLTSTHETATLQPPLPPKVWTYEIDVAAQVLRSRAGDRPFALPLDPMHGTVGLAPAGGQAISTITSGLHGGNLDTPEIRAGVTVYLGVNVDGALFGLGDGHARQGEGEVCGVGVECAMDTIVAVDILPGVPTVQPRLESDTHLMRVGIGRPLEDCYRQAHTDMVAWISNLAGLDQLDAYQWLSQAGTARVGNVCDPAYTLLARIAKDLLSPSLPAYGGVHQRLRQLAVSV
jgi:amidase